MVKAPPASPKARAIARLLPDWHARVRRNSDERLFIVTHVNHRRMEVTLTASLGAETLRDIGPARLAHEFTEEPTS